jgi:glycosyltransferase involved in cell wall biosynthesis
VIADEKHKFIIVLGHESSGTRLIADTLAHATGFEYDDGENKTDLHGKLIDSFLTKTVHRWWENPHDIAYDKSRITRRSLPHGGLDDTELKNTLIGHATGRAFLDPSPLINGLKRVGYDVRIVLTVRDRSVSIHSKCREHTHGNGDLAATEMDHAMDIMQTVLLRHHDNCFVCSYEALMALGAPYLQKLYAFLDIRSDYCPVLKDGNRKYLPEYTGDRSALRAKSIFALRLGVVTRPDEHQWGGDLRALRSAKEGLAELGIQVRMAQTAAEVTDCNFVFLSNTCIDQRRNAQMLLERGVPFGLFGFHEDFLAYYPQSLGFTEYVSHCLQGDEENGVKLRIEDLWENPEVFNCYNHEIPLDIRNNIPVMEAATVCVASSYREAETMRRDCPSCNTGVVFWNIPFLRQANEYSEEFLELVGLAKGEYILQVGRLETRKNQLGTVLASANLDIPVVFIATKGYQNWYDLLVVNAAAKYRKAPTLLISEEYPSQIVGGKMRIIQMPRGQLLSESCLFSAYRNCGLHVHPAFWEAPGYTYLEAAKVGVPTVASEWGTLQDYCVFGSKDKFMNDRFSYVRPYDLPQIERAIRQNFGRQVSKGFSHPIFERSEQDVARDILHCILDHTV